MANDATATLGLLFSADPKAAFDAARQVETALRELSTEQRKVTEDARKRAEQAAAAQKHWATAIDHVRTAYRKLFDFLRGGFQTMMTWTKRLTVGLGAVVALTARSGIQLNAAVEMATATMEQFLGSRAAAEKLVAEVKRFGDVSPFRFPELAQSTAFLTAMGVTGQGGPLAWTARAGAMAAARGDLSGAGIEMMARGIGYLRAGQKGEAMEALRRAGLSPEVWEQYGARFRRTTGGITWLSSTEELMDILARAVDDKFVPMLEKMSVTVVGLYSTFEDMVQSMAGDITTGAYKQLGKLLDQANQYLEAFAASDAWKRFVDGLAALAEAGAAKAFDGMRQFFNWLTSGGPQRAWQWATDLLGPSLTLLRDAAVSIDWKKAGEGLRSVLEMLMRIVAWAAEHPKLVLGGYLFNAMGGGHLLAAGVSGLRAMRAGGMVRAGLPTAAGAAGLPAAAAAGGRSFLGLPIPGGGALGGLRASWAAGGGLMGRLMSSGLGRRLGLGATPINWQPIVRSVNLADDYAAWAAGGERAVPAILGRQATKGALPWLARALPWLGRIAGPIGWTSLAADLGARASVWGGERFGATSMYAQMEQAAPWANRALSFMPGGWLPMTYARGSYMEAQAARPEEGFQERWERAKAKEQALRDAEAARNARAQEITDSHNARHSYEMARAQASYGLAQRPTSSWALGIHQTGGQGYREAVSVNQTFFINDRAEVGQIVQDSLAEVGIA